MAVHRGEFKEYVLGADVPTSMERFNTAVNALADRAVEERGEHREDGHHDTVGVLA